MLTRHAFASFRSVSRQADRLVPAILAGVTNCSWLRFFGQPASQTHPHLVQDGEVTPGITQGEYRTRRHSLMELIAQSPQGGHHKHHVVIVPSATRVYMTNDIPYPFRQNTDFLYLCGFQEPNSVLILESHGPLPEHRATLFVPKRDPAKELWEGARSGTEGAMQLTGVDNAYDTDHLGEYLRNILRDGGEFMTWYDYNKVAHAEFHVRYIAEFLQQRMGSLVSVRNVVQPLRWVKSPGEIALMTRSCEIASQAFKEVMKFSHPKVNEAHLFAKMDFECRLRGAEYLAYPPVVAGGNRANTIHYVSNNQLIHEDDMVLMDAGCEYHGYASDITRTWPVSGHFTGPQKELYEAVLEVNQACIHMSTTDITVEQIFHEMLRLLGKQLQRMGIISQASSGADLQRLVRAFCPHHVGHYLGMDVHDTDAMPRHVNLQPGVVITIEPGVYISHSWTDVCKDFRGIGIRIEDNILITRDGPQNLTQHCPKHPTDIQRTVLAKS